MYFIELIVKKFKKHREEPELNILQKEQSPDYEACEHNFMPVDSTGETLSCINCGLLIKRSELKNKNFFMGGN